MTVTDAESELAALRQQLADAQTVARLRQDVIRLWEAEYQRLLEHHQRGVRQRQTERACQEVHAKLLAADELPMAWTTRWGGVKP